MTLKEAIEAAHETQVACRGKEYDPDLWGRRERAERELAEALVDAMRGPR